MTFETTIIVRLNEDEMKNKHMVQWLTNNAIVAFDKVGDNEPSSFLMHVAGMHQFSDKFGSYGWEYWNND